jgi:hypothetical protein
MPPGVTPSWRTASAAAPSEAHHDDRRDLIAATATMKIHQPKLSGGG